MSKVDQALVDEIDLLHMIKTAIFGYVLIFGLIIRVNHFVLFPIVLIAGSPFFICHLLR